TTEGAPIGGVARARGGAVTVKVHVECAPWVSVDRVKIARASGDEGAPKGEVAVSLKPTPLGARAADLTFTLRAPKDDAFIVVATGASPMSPVLTGDPSEITPYAMTGATWIDADGDGRALGR